MFELYTKEKLNPTYFIDIEDGKDSLYFKLVDAAGVDVPDSFFLKVDKKTLEIERYTGFTDKLGIPLDRSGRVMEVG